MTIGLVRNQHDENAVDLCGSVNGEWVVVWGTLHVDCISDAVAAESELIKPGQWYSHTTNIGNEVTEVVIVTLAEWERLMSEGDELREQVEQLQDRLDKLEAGE